MKLPLWTKAKDGKWVRFPYHLLETHNGRYGTYCVTQEFLEFCRGTGYSWYYYFEYIPVRIPVEPPPEPYDYNSPAYMLFYPMKEVPHD